MLGLVLTRKQRLLDLYLALGMQVVALIVASEMQRAHAEAPFLGLTIGTYIASALATLYVLVVAEFKPVAMETCTFVTWIVCNTAFAAILLVPPTPEQLPEERERAACVAPATVDRPLARLLAGK